MFHSREVNQRINRLHERAIRLVYNDYISTFEHLLVHHSNLHFLSIELDKVVNDLTTNIFSDIFLRNNQEVSLHSQNYFALPRVRTESYGERSIALFGTINLEYYSIRNKKLIFVKQV